MRLTERVLAVAAIVALVIGGVFVLEQGRASAQMGMHRPATTTGHAAQGPMMQGSMRDSMQNMMVMHRRMAVRVRAMDARLDALVARMNHATGSRKVALMAQVIDALVAQRNRMQALMGRMQMDEMSTMQSMMSRMGTGGHPMAGRSGMHGMMGK